MLKYRYDFRNFSALLFSSAGEALEEAELLVSGLEECKSDLIGNIDEIRTQMVPGTKLVGGHEEAALKVKRDYRDLYQEQVL